MHSIRVSARGQGGFTMALVMLVMLVAMGLCMVALGASGGDLQSNQRSGDEKRAYAAAEAGVSFYLDQLAADNGYWVKCDSGLPAGTPVRNQWTAPAGYRPGDAGDPRVWKTLVGDATSAYTIEIMPAPGKASCLPDRSDTILDPDTGSFTIRATGRAGTGGKVRRSIVATLRRRSFLDFVYFTDFESLEAKQLAFERGGGTWTTRNPTYEQWASSLAGCASYRRDGRSGRPFPGERYGDPDGSGPKGTSWWPANQFADYAGKECQDSIGFGRTDNLFGPFHTNDSVAVQTGAEFGRPGRSDPVELYETFGGNPVYNTSDVRKGDSYEKLPLPTSNAQVAATALPAYTFQGRTVIQLTGNTMTVNGTSMALPSNGVISVVTQSGYTCPGYNLQIPDPSPVQTGCGLARVSGTYSKNLTITTQDDIVITGNLTATAGSQALLGLVATQYVRMYNPMSGVPYGNRCSDSSTGALPAPTERTLQAAILSLNRIFTVDNYQCGDALGQLHVLGAIAQRFRGRIAEGTVGSPDRTSYEKDYVYDDRLRYRSPPFFLTPLQSAWRIVRETELSPAR